MKKEKAEPIFINYRKALSAKEASGIYLMLNGLLLSATGNGER